MEILLLSHIKVMVKVLIFFAQLISANTIIKLIAKVSSNV